MADIETDLINTILTNGISFSSSITEGSIPTVLPEAGIGLNLNDKIIYSLDETGNVIKVGGNYDDILLAHFGERNAHNTRIEDIEGLEEALNNASSTGGSNTDTSIPYTTRNYVNEPTFTVQDRHSLVSLDYWEGNDVIYTISHDDFLVGDKVHIARHSNTAGSVTVGLTDGEFVVRGITTDNELLLAGTSPLGIDLQKANSTTWIVKVNRL